MPSLKNHGYEIHRNIFSIEEIRKFREEASRLSQSSNSACVRHLRDKSPTFSKLSVCHQLITRLPPGVLPVRSLLFDKTVDENWPVAWHQDLTIAVEQQKPTEGYGSWSIKDQVVHVAPPLDILRNMVTARIHLDNTSSKNGALMVIPKSHLQGKIPQNRISSESTHPITCECQPGDVLLMSPLILHSSRKSEIPNRRRVLHFEYALRHELNPQLSWYEKIEKA